LLLNYNLNTLKTLDHPDSVGLMFHFFMSF